MNDAEAAISTFARRQRIRRLAGGSLTERGLGRAGWCAPSRASDRERVLGVQQRIVEAGLAAMPGRQAGGGQLRRPAASRGANVTCRNKRGAALHETLGRLGRRRESRRCWRSCSPATRSPAPGRAPGNLLLWTPASGQPTRSDSSSPPRVATRCPDVHRRSNEIGCQHPRLQQNSRPAGLREKRARRRVRGTPGRFIELAG